jgi:hypothetical protein
MPTAALNARQYPRPSPTIMNDCDKFVAQCISDDADTPNGAYRTVFEVESCVFGFICRSPTETPDQVIEKELWWSKAIYPYAADEPTFSTDVRP